MDDGKLSNWRDHHYLGEESFDAESRDIFKKAMYLAIDDENAKDESAFESFVHEVATSPALDNDKLLAILMGMFHCQLSREGYATVFFAAKQLSEHVELSPDVLNHLREICLQPSVKDWFPDFCATFLRVGVDLSIGNEEQP